MKKLLLLIATLSFACVANAQEDEKSYAIDGTEWNDRLERDRHEEEIKYERKCNLFSLHIGEKVRKSLVNDTIAPLCAEYDEYTDRIREIEMSIAFGLGSEAPTKEAKAMMKKKGLTLGEYRASNKEPFGLKELRDIYNIMLEDHLTIIKLVETIAEDETITDANAQVERVMLKIVDRYANKVMLPLDNLLRNVEDRSY